MTLECEQCSATTNVRRFWPDIHNINHSILACWDCRKDEIYRRANQGGMNAIREKNAEKKRAGTQSTWDNFA